MAKVIQDTHSVVVEPWWAKGKIVLIGLSMGLLWWVLTGLLRQFIIEPLACRNLSSATACVDSLGVSGNVAMVLVAVLGVAVLVRLVLHRPIIVTLGTAVVLWGLGSLLSGLPGYVVILSSVVLFTLSYALFYLVARIQWLWLSLIVALVIAVAVRLIVAI